MSEEIKCKLCGKSDIELDERRGQYCCRHCGSVCGENAMTSEVSFYKSAAQGKFLSSGAGGCTYFSATSNKSLMDQNTLKRAKAHKILQQIGTQLNMKQTDIDAAKGIYVLAQENNFIQGRHSKLVAGAALYIVCRKERIPHMLIDFSDVLKISLYSLAACYIKLVRQLQWCEKIPQIDPSLFIHRFCAKLEFGDKERDVALTALRLMQSFKRDWITQGRRPAGLCGAAIRIAASFHGFKRSTKQIIGVVKVCEETVKKRIEEFKATPMASLTQEAFEAIDFEKEAPAPMDPPSFARRDDLKIKELASSEKVKLQLESAASEIDHELQIAAAPQPDANDKDKSEPKLPEEKKGEREEPTNGPTEKPAEEMQLVPVETAVEEVKKEERRTVVWKSETLSDIDDAEVEPYLLTDKEVSLKTEIWESMNNEWLTKQSDKGAKKAAKEPTKRRAKRVEPEKTTSVLHPAQMLPKFSKIGAKGSQSMMRT